MNRVFLDMDGVLADFDRLKLELECTGEQLKCMPDAFDRMQPIAGAIAGVRSLIGMGFECWIATKPPTGIPHAYADKAKWIIRHLPELQRRIVMTHHKGFLGDERDYLVDDRPHKAHCEEFRGVLIPFVNGMDWPTLLDMFRAYRDGASQETEVDDDHVCGVCEGTQRGVCNCKTPTARPACTCEIDRDMCLIHS